MCVLVAAGEDGLEDPGQDAVAVVDYHDQRDGCDRHHGHQLDQNIHGRPGGILERVANGVAYNSCRVLWSTLHVALVLGLGGSSDRCRGLGLFFGLCYWLLFGSHRFGWLLFYGLFLSCFCGLGDGLFRFIARCAVAFVASGVSIRIGSDFFLLCFLRFVIRLLGAG